LSSTIKPQLHSRFLKTSFPLRGKRSQFSSFDRLQPINSKSNQFKELDPLHLRGQSQLLNSYNHHLLKLVEDI